MFLEGELCRLRAVEPADVDAMYAWENDMEIWRVSNTVAPYSHHALRQMVDNMCGDIYAARQLRLMIEPHDGEHVSGGDGRAGAAGGGTAVGAIDIFEFDPLNSRAGVGILVYDRRQRGRGYAADALRCVERYAREVLFLRQLWCNVAADNAASLALFEKAGFVRVGVKADWTRRADGWADEIMLQKLLH